MKNVLLITIGLIAALFQAAFANPLPPFVISEYSSSPPWIEMLCMDGSDLPGMVIHTTGGDAVVDSGVIPDIYGIVLFDSSNTSGFCLNPDGDSIVIEDMYIYIGYGCMGPFSVPPLANESAQWSYYHNDSHNFCATPSPGTWEESPPCEWGQTEVIINEVNSQCSWGERCRFVELFNRSIEPVEISGWQIICNARYTISPNTMIQPGKRFILDEDQFPAGFGLSPSCDNVYLLNDAGSVVDQTGWSSDHGADVSFMRFPDGGPDSIDFWHFVGFNDETSIGFENGFPTRRAPNRHETPGLKVIGIAADVSSTEVNIYWTNPIWLTVFDQAIVRRSSESFPQTPFDGELIYEGGDQQFTDRNVVPNQTIYYTVFARTGCGEYSEPDSESQISVVVPSVGVDDEQLPKKALLLSSYPNPFNATTLIKYTVPEAGKISLAVYNISGQKVAELYAGHREAGEYSIVWGGPSHSSGVYFAQLQSDVGSRAIKLILLK